MQARWSTGIWLGKLWRSDEHVLAVDEKVIRARAIRALPDDESWVQDEVAKIVATPWNFNPKKEEQEGAAPECDSVRTEARRGARARACVQVCSERSEDHEG